MSARQSIRPRCSRLAVASRSRPARSPQRTAQTLKTVKDRGALVCGVNEGLPGFSAPDDKGDWTGFDVDFCRAVAAAIFDDPEQGPVRAAQRRASASRALQSGADRHPLAQLDLDHVARERAEAHLPGGHLL